MGHLTDPNIALQTRVGNTVLDLGQVGQSFTNSLIGLGNARRAAQASEREAQLAPLREQLLQAQVAGGQQANVQAQQEAGRTNTLLNAGRAVDAFKRGDIRGVQQSIAQAFPDPAVQQEQLAQFQADPQTYINRAEDLLARATVSTSIEQQKVDIRRQELAQRRQLIEGESQRVFDKEVAKLSAQFNLKPQVSAAVTLAVGGAKAAVDAIGEAKSNATALRVYDTALNGLVEALGGTTTGPVAGFLPAVTTNQQIAQGAIAAMAPILKQLFRGAGEGTFTDKDQELLTDMIPTRKDSPEARATKLSNIDAIIRAKLNQPAPTVAGQAPATAQPQAAAQPQVIRFDAQGNPI